MDKRKEVLQMLRDFHDIKISSREYAEKWGWKNLDNEGLVSRIDEALNGN